MSLSGSVPTRYPQGVATAKPLQLYSNLLHHQPFQFYEVKNDFNLYTAADWTVTSTNSGANTLLDALGGQISVVTGATGTNYQGITDPKKTFAFGSGCQVWFNCLFKSADMLDASFIIGMVAGSPGSETDGVFFTKASATLNVSGVMRQGSTSTTQTAITTVDATHWVNLGFYYDGRPTPTLYWYSSTPLSSPLAFGAPAIYGGVVVASAGANSPSGVTLANLPATTTLLARQFYVVTHQSATDTFDLDELYGACEIARF